MPHLARRSAFGRALVSLQPLWCSHLGRFLSRWLAAVGVCRRVHGLNPPEWWCAMESCAQPHTHTLLTKGAHLAYNLIQSMFRDSSSWKDAHSFQRGHITPIPSLQLYLLHPLITLCNTASSCQSWQSLHVLYTTDDVVPNRQRSYLP